MDRRKLMLVLLLALTAGGLASYLSLGSMSQAAIAAPAPAGRSILAAARVLPPGTMIQAADVRPVPWAAESMPVGVFTRAEEVVGRVVVASVGADEPIVASVLAAPGSGSGLVGLIPAGQRAISVAVDEVAGINGFMGPGARVDVVATLETGGGSGDAVARLVLQDVEVLASGHQLQPDPNGAPQQAPVVTLLVTPDQAESLVLATHKGRIQLVLRGSADRAAVATSGVRASALSGSGGAASSSAAPTLRSGSASAGTRAASATSVRQAERVVEVFNGSARAVVTY